MELVIVGLVITLMVIALAAYFARAVRSRSAPSTPHLNETKQSHGFSAIVRAEPARVVNLPYRVVDSLLSPAERSFHGVLRRETDLLGLDVFVKVRMRDIFWLPESADRNSRIARIQQKHVDFLVCDRDRIEPLLGIELDDRSHERADRRERDAFVDQVFHDAGLPLMRCRVKTAYTVSDIRASLIEALGQRSAPADLSLARSVCPKCGSTLIEKVRRGSQARFLACPEFPNCRYIQGSAA